MTDFPDFYQPGRVGSLFYPDIMQFASAAEEAAMAPASLDQKLVYLVIIDMQIDFCHEQGSLFVPGGIMNFCPMGHMFYKLELCSE